MHYYKRNIGDYHKKAGRLTMLQHGAYTLLMDACYDREKFPRMDEAIEWLWAGSEEEIEAIEFVLNKFFDEVDGVFIQRRIESELNDYAEKAATNKRIAIEREEKRRLDSTNRARSVDETRTDRHLTTNQEPLTTNQEDKDISANARINSQQVLDSFHEILDMLPKVHIYSDKRKTMVRGFFKKRSSESGREFTIENLRAYFGYIKSNCTWMLYPSKDFAGNTRKPRDFDYVMSDRCYIAVKEQRHDDIGK